MTLILACGIDVSETESVSAWAALMGGAWAYHALACYIYIIMSVHYNYLDNIITSVYPKIDDCHRMDSRPSYMPVKRETCVSTWSMRCWPLGQMSTPRQQMWVRPGASGLH